MPAAGGVTNADVDSTAIDATSVTIDTVPTLFSEYVVTSVIRDGGELRLDSWAVDEYGTLDWLDGYDTGDVEQHDGTAGGTMAPLFTIGGGAGSVLGSVAIAFFPGIGLDVRIPALVGMAAMFTGASRALLASVVFAFETTRQPLALLPLLAGCTGAYLISLLRMRHTIMTERLARRGVPVITEYSVDSQDLTVLKPVTQQQR